MRKDWQTLELCDRFFDSLEQQDYDTVERLLRARRP